jgi:prepilin-type N-terminal cleavage/methylation domain-containing protein
MRTGVGQSAFSLVELIVVLAVILILAGTLLGVGKYLMVRANADLTASELEVIATALQQYYDDFGKFPFFTMDNTGAYVTDADGSGFLLDEYMNIVGYTVFQGDIPVPANDLGFDSSAALFYFLDKNPNSRKIVEALTDSLISSKDTSGQSIQITLAAGQTIDLPRFIDPWGTSIRYEYIDGTAFPKLTSAGPDMTFGTPDDIVN